jgi:hypothetical protein
MHSLINSFNTTVQFEVTIDNNQTIIERTITFNREPSDSFRADLGDYWSLHPNLAQAVTKQIKQLNDDLEVHIHSLI